MGVTASWRIALVGASLVAASAAGAQDSRAELARRELLSRAEAARARGDHAQALELGSQALEIRATPSLRLLLAQEHRAADHPIDAFDQATGCVREAEADTALRNRELILRECRAIVAAVEPRIARLVVRVIPRTAPGLQVRVGENVLPTALIGAPMPMMPGPIAVNVRAMGMTDERRELTLRAGAEDTVAITLAAASAPAVTTPVPEPVAAIPPPAVMAVPPRRADMPRTDATRRTLGWVSLGAGVLGIGLGIGGALVFDGAVGAYDAERLPSGAQCPGAGFPGTQPPPCQDHLDRGALGNAMMWGGFIGGGVLGITGAVLLLTSGASRESPRASLQCGITGAGWQCAGSF